MRKEVKNQTVVEFADMPAWDWAMSEYESGSAIKIENISNIEQVGIRYKYPARSDPRWKKTALKKESVSPDWATGGKSIVFPKKSKGYDADQWSAEALKALPDEGELGGDDEVDDALIDQALIDAGEA